MFPRAMLACCCGRPCWRAALPAPPADAGYAFFAAAPRRYFEFLCHERVERARDAATSTLMRTSPFRCAPRLSPMRFNTSSPYAHHGAHFATMLMRANIIIHAIRHRGYFARAPPLLFIDAAAGAMPALMSPPPLPCRRHDPSATLRVTPCRSLTRLLLMPLMLTLPRCRRYARTP